MPNTGVIDLSVTNRLIQADNLMVKMQEHFDPFILDWQLRHPSMFRDRIPMGKYPAFMGVSQESYIYRGSNSAPQAGLVGWTDVAPSSKPTGGSAGVDACNYNPVTFTWSYDKVGYNGKRREWKSPIFCVNDLYTQDSAKQQLAFIVAAGAECTDQTREVYNRESYFKIAADAGKFVAFVEGLGLSFIDNSLCRVTYDPQAVDSNGDTYIEIDASIMDKISTLNWSPFNMIRSYLADAAPDAGVGTDSGMPIFSLLIDLMDFETYVMNDANVREDMRYAQAEQLIKGYNMGFHVYRGMAITHDTRQARFTASTITTGSKLRLTRVLPRRATRQGVVGLIPEANPDYATAEYGTAVLFLNNVAQILVPDPISNLGSGLTFGPAPGFNGQWTWINNKGPNDNQLGETGYFFARFQYHLKPMRYAEHAMVFLYRRCTQTLKSTCPVDSVSDAVSSAYLAGAALVSVDTTLRTVSMTLAKKLAVTLNAKVTITKDDSNTFTAYVLETKDAPTYVFGWASGATNAPTATADMNDPTITKVAVA